MSQSLESLPEMSEPMSLTGKARAKARAETWKMKQNARTMAEVEAERERRFFPYLDEQGRADLEARFQEIEAKARLELEREATRESHETFVEPTLDLEKTDFQTISLPATTVPLTVAVQDIYTSVRQRVGPSLSDWCPPEVLYRLSHAQFLFYADPFTYHSLSTACDYENFEGIVRCIQLNAHYVNDDFEIIPVIDNLNPRCITLDSVDRFRRMSSDFYRFCFPAILEYDLSFLRTMRPTANGCAAPYHTYDEFGSDNNPVLPYDYDLTQLHQDGRMIARCLKYYRASDTGMYRPRNVLTPLLPEAPYLALLNQLPIRELARRVRSNIPYAVFPEQSDWVFPLEPRVVGSDGYIPLLDPTLDQRDELTAMVSTGDLPSGSHSAWDEFSEEESD